VAAIRDTPGDSTCTFACTGYRRSQNGAGEDEYDGEFHDVELVGQYVQRTSLISYQIASANLFIYSISGCI
jgi:hypothetical protein